MDTAPPNHGISMASEEGDPATEVQREPQGVYEAPARPIHAMLLRSRMENADGNDPQPHPGSRRRI